MNTIIGMIILLVKNLLMLIVLFCLKILRKIKDLNAEKIIGCFHEKGLLLNELELNF